MVAGVLFIRFWLAQDGTLSINTVNVVWYHLPIYRLFTHWDMGCIHLFSMHLFPRYYDDLDPDIIWKIDLRFFLHSWVTWKNINRAANLEESSTKSQPCLNMRHKFNPQKNHTIVWLLGLIFCGQQTLIWNL